MASELYVETLKGLTSGANANKVIIPSGQTLEVTDGLRSADMPTGSVLQVVSSGEISNNESVTSTSFVDTYITMSITPTSASSKILVNAYFYMMVQGASRSRGGVRLLRRISGQSDAVLSGGIAETLHIRESSAGASTELSAMQSYQFYDSPNTTSAVEYTIQAKLTDGAAIYFYGTTSNSPKNIIATEIAG